MCVDFAAVRLRRVLNGTDDFGFMRLAFLHKLFDALRARIRIPSQSLQRAGLPCGR